jgi:hypothetical protein
LYTLQYFQTQMNCTKDAIDYLLKKGYSTRVLEPYKKHIDYLTEIIQTTWSEFKSSINDDKDRIDLNSSIVWRPVTGVKYQELVNDDNFIKRWN